MNESLSSHLPRIVAIHNMGKKETLNNHNVNNNNVSNPFSPPSSGFAKLAAKGYRRPSFPDSFKGRISREKFNEYLDEFERLAGESLGEFLFSRQTNGGKSSPLSLSRRTPFPFRNQG